MRKNNVMMMISGNHPINLLYPYQQIGAQFLAKKGTAGLFDDMGLGKTLQAILACDQVNARKVLVICPASARINWKREFQRFQLIRREVTIIASGHDRPQNIEVVIVSFDLVTQEEVHAFLMDRRYDVLIIDESHFLKNRKAKRTQAILGPACDRQAGLAGRAGWIFALSGTPAPNNPAEIWPVIHALFPQAITRNDQVMDYWTFLNRYCTWREGPHGVQITGGRNLAELRKRLAPHFLRRKKAEVLSDLPPIRFETIPLSPEGMLRELWALEDGPEGDAIRTVLEQAKGDGDFTSIAMHVAKLRRVTGLAKVQPVLSLVRDEMDAGLKKIVLFAHHREVIQGLEEGLHAFGVVSLHGGRSNGQRQAAIDSFQNDPATRVFIGQLSAAGTAITLTAASHVLFAESSWVPADNAQAAMRCHRIGQRNSVLVRFVTLAGSLDERITEVLRRKTAVINAIFN